jgi:type IV conjugative transfer system coupling protein TraD
MNSRHSTPIGDQSFSSTFLRGGQIFMHNARMYWQLLSRLFMVCVVLTFGTAFMFALTFADPIAARLAGSRSMAWAFAQFGQTDREMTIIDENRDILHMTVEQVLANPFIRAETDIFFAALERNFVIAGIIGSTIFLFMLYWFVNHGRRLGSDTHLRGATIVEAKQLAVEIHSSNHALARRFKVKKYRPYSLAGIPYAFRAETTHTLLAGTTGAGKTQAMVPLLQEIRRRGDRAIIYDKMRSFVPMFFDEARGDVILNPLDDRCPQWSPFHDCRSLEDFRQIAAALMPDPGSSDPFWVESARVVFAVTAHKLYRANRRTNKDLIDLLLRAPLANLSAFLHNTIAGSLIDTSNPKTSQSIRATLTTALASLQAMERAGVERDSFSIRQWVEDDDASSFMFMTSRSDKHESLRGLITVWMELAMNSIMAQDRDPDRTIWFFIDELPSLYKLPSLEKGLAEGRQFGAAYVLGIQSMSQLESIYGDDVATTITGLARTKLILNLGDPKTAEVASKYIGRAEVQRAQRGVGFGAHQTRDGVNYTIQDKIDDLVMSDQLQRLPNLSGYLVPAGAFPTARVTLEFIKLGEKTPGFVERPDEYEELDGTYFEEGDNTEASSPAPWATSGSNANPVTAHHIPLVASAALALAADHLADDDDGEGASSTAGDPAEATTANSDGSTETTGATGEGGPVQAHDASAEAPDANATDAPAGWDTANNDAPSVDIDAVEAEQAFFNFQSEASVGLDLDDGR